MPAITHRPEEFIQEQEARRSPLQKVDRKGKGKQVEVTLSEGDENGDFTPAGVRMGGYVDRADRSSKCAMSMPYPIVPSHADTSLL